MDDNRQFDNNGVEIGGTPEVVVAPVEESPRARRRNFPWNRIGAFLLFLGLLVYGTGWVFGGSGGVVYFNDGLQVVSATEIQQQNRTSETFYGETNLHSISIASTTGNITIVPSNSPYASVTTNGRGHVGSSIENGQLTVGFARDSSHVPGLQIMNMGNVGISIERDRHGGRGNSPRMSFGSSGNNMGRSNVRVYVPESVQVINVTSTTGNIRIDDISIDNLIARSTTGNITFEGDSLDSANMYATTGTIRLRANIGSEFIARTTTGTIRFSTPQPESDFHINSSATTGNIRTNGDRRNTRNFIGGNGDIQIITSTTTGNTHLDFGQ